MIYNFESIGNENRIEVDFLLIAPILEGNYNVYVASFDISTNSIVDLNSVLLPISSTYGFMKEFRTHAMKAAIRLKAG